MNEKNMTEIQEELFSLQDLKYKEFQAKLMPNINPEYIIGVRNPNSKNIAKKIIKQNKADEFVSKLPHKYYEENNVQAYIINETKDYEKVILMLKDFLTYVNNWATCDIISPTIFKKNIDKLINEITIWIKSCNTYTVRFGIRMLMCFFLDENFKKEYLNIPLEVKSDEYYINMMIAWFYATALVKQYDKTIKIIEDKSLDKWVHNKTIQKAVESFRVSDEHKKYLRSLKIK